MEIGILHLSDIHFDENNRVSEKLESLSRVVSSDFVSIEHMYIVVSGDIANTGKSEDYAVADQFFLHYVLK